MSRKHKSRKIGLKHKEEVLRHEENHTGLLADLEWDRLDEAGGGRYVSRVDLFHADLERLADRSIGSESEWEALLDTGLDHLDTPLSSDVPPADQESDPGPLAESPEDQLSCLCRQNTLASTIRNFTGWEISDVPEGEGDLLCPVFTDGEKYYRFITWRIIVTFHNFPGMTLLPWSPETLEPDLDQAMRIQVTKEQDLKGLAQALDRSFTREELRRVWELLQDEHRRG